MVELLKLIRSEGFRSWLYGVALAVGALAAGYGLATSEQVALWVGLVVALVGNAQAFAHRPTKRPRLELHGLEGDQLETRAADPGASSSSTTAAARYGIRKGSGREHG